MPRERCIEEPPRLVWLVVSTAYEHGRSDVAQPELTRDHDPSLSVVGSDRPSTRHTVDGTDAAGRPELARKTGIRSRGIPVAKIPESGRLAITALAPYVQT